MKTLEEKMRLQQKLFLDERLPAELRREAFRRYSELHARRTPETIRRMEKEKGLVS